MARESKRETELDDGLNVDETLSNLDIAIAHWHINSWGGAEYLITKLAEAIGESTVYTVGVPEPTDPNPYGDIDFYDVTKELSGFSVPIRRRIGRPAEYGLWEDVDWRRYGSPDILITSGSTTRAVITPDTTLHLNYCHSPPRWFYDLYHDRKDSAVGRLARPLLRYLRIWDNALDDRVDHYLANSPVIARRLWKYYKRDSEILYPPVDLDSYYNAGDDGFYLHLGRLDTEKGIEEIVDAFESMNHRIVFAGGEGDADVLDQIEKNENMEYVGFVSEERKYELLATCRAVVFNGRNEDFGIVPIEANASGKPCLTRNDGFPGLFIEDGENGYLHDGSAASIRTVVEEFEHDPIDNSPISLVETFSIGSFKHQLYRTVVSADERFSTKFSFDR